MYTENRDIQDEFIQYCQYWKLRFDFAEDLMSQISDDEVNGHLSGDKNQHRKGKEHA